MRISVLAVDDCRTIRDMISLALDANEFEVHLAEDGQQALERLDDVEPDVVITDLNMPRLDGFALIEAIRKRTDTRTTPILILTTDNSTYLTSRAREAGATGWIVKPFARDKLVRALRIVAGYEDMTVSR